MRSLSSQDCFLLIFGGREPETAWGANPPGVSGCLTAAYALWNCPMSLGPGKVLAEQRPKFRIKISLDLGD